jgi:uncharacterized protein
MPTVTTYPILNPAGPIDPATAALRATQCALTVMAKAPHPGTVKTRLAPLLTLDQAAALNICFLRDTTQNLVAVTGSAGLISYTPVGHEHLFNDLLPSAFALVPQRGDTFGERLLFTAQDIIACGYASVCLIDSDSPTVPAAAYQQAVAALAQPGDRIVLGPAHDGGYYLIGLKRPHAAPFINITWSTSTVAAETRDRCRSANLDLVELPLWYDVDDAASLEILTAELLRDISPAFAVSPGYPAPQTRAFLRKLENKPVQGSQP